MPMVTCYIKDNKTGKEYRLSFVNILEVKAAQVFSLLIYGYAIIALVYLLYIPMKLFGIINSPSVNVILIVLGLGYLLELALLFTKRTSFSLVLASFIVMLLWSPIIFNIVKNRINDTEKVTVKNKESEKEKVETSIRLSTKIANLILNTFNMIKINKMIFYSSLSKFTS